MALSYVFMMTKFGNNSIEELFCFDISTGNSTTRSANWRQISALVHKLSWNKVLPYSESKASYALARGNKASLAISTEHLIYWLCVSRVSRLVTHSRTTDTHTVLCLL